VICGAFCAACWLNRGQLAPSHNDLPGIIRQYEVVERGYRQKFYPNGQHGG